MTNSEAVSDLNLTSILRSDTQQSSNNSLLFGIAAKGMVEYREKSLRETTSASVPCLVPCTSIQIQEPRWMDGPAKVPGIPVAVL